VDLGRPALKGTPWVLPRYISLSLFTLLARFPAALNSDVFFIICTFFAADLCLERKGSSRRGRKRWSPLASSERWWRITSTVEAREKTGWRRIEKEKAGKDKGRAKA